MTNYEWLVKQGIGALMDWRSKTCSYCASRDVDGRCVGKSCRSGIEAWLEAPHVEPDSWEKLLADINRYLSQAGTDELVAKWLDRQAAITRAECDVELRDFIDVKALADNPALPTNDCAAKVMIDCTLPPTVYCGKYNYLEGNPDESECVERMCKHIAIRITSITCAERAEWKAKAEKYRLRVADYECELIRNEGECRRFTIPPKTCVRDGRMCQEVLKAVDGDD